MSEILIHQTLKMQNVILYRCKMAQEQVNTAMGSISQIMKLCGTKKNGPVVTSTFSIKVIDNQQVIDIEILVPVDKEIAVPEGYIFKKEFLLTNAVKISHIGNPALMQNTANELMKYISENKLTPITSGYNVTVKEPTSQQDIENMIVDIYVGVSPNIL